MMVSNGQFDDLLWGLDQHHAFVLAGIKYAFDCAGVQEPVA